MCWTEGSVWNWGAFDLKGSIVLLLWSVPGFLQSEQTKHFWWKIWLSYKILSSPTIIISAKKIAWFYEQNSIFRVVKKNRKLSLLSNGEFFSRFLCEKWNSKNLVGMVFCIGSTWAGSVGGSNLWITNVTYYLIYTLMIAFTVFWMVYAKSCKIKNRLPTWNFTINFITIRAKSARFSKIHQHKNTILSTSYELFHWSHTY